MALSTIVTRVTQPTPNTATNRSQLITKTVMTVTTMDRVDTTATTGMAEDLQATHAVGTHTIKDTRSLTKTDIQNIISRCMRIVPTVLFQFSLSHKLRKNRKLN